MEEKPTTPQPLLTAIPKPTPGHPVRFTSSIGLPARTDAEIDEAHEKATAEQIWGGLRR